MKVEPYLFLEGRTEEALAFYTRALGAKVDMCMRYSDSPNPVPQQMLPPGGASKIMHSSFIVGETRINASDGHVEGEASFASFSLAITADGEADARRLFDGLASEGGEVRSPLQKTFFSPCFGMVRDRFGIGWMVLVR
ncbi:MAG TPA: VOC family protein [Usitatibacter sp.]|jgi:PhnB protein|nr:VOC family protein [Usitatibacter sp.]